MVESKNIVINRHKCYTFTLSFMFFVHFRIRKIDQSQRSTKVLNICHRPAILLQLCVNPVIIVLLSELLGQSCNEFDISVKLVTSWQQVVTDILTTWDKRGEQNLLTDLLN